MKRKLVMGVDPGLNGAIAFYNPTSREIKIYDMPVTLIPLGKNKKREINKDALSTIIGGYALDIEFAVVEKVGVMGGHEGTVSMFNFGFGAGLLSGVLAANLIPTIYVLPSVWKSSLGLTSDKNESIDRARSMFSPEYHHYFKRKKDDGRAEAALLSYYGASWVNV